MATPLACVDALALAGTPVAMSYRGSANFQLSEGFGDKPFAGVASRFDLSELQLSASCSLSQPFDSHLSCSALTGMRLWKRQRVVASDRKLVRLASPVTRHENMRMVVSRNLKHATHLIGDSLPGTRMSGPKG
jgi:hypothetical protein